MATTIYTYLHNDALYGSRIVSIDDCMCKLYNIKRKDSVFLKDFSEELQKPVLYILLNKDMSKAYISETDDFNKRIIQHLAKKYLGEEVMVFLGSNDDTLSKTEKFFKYVQILAKFIGYDIFECRPKDTLTSTETVPQFAVMPENINFTNEDLKGRIFLSLNGNNKYSKRELVLEIVKEFLKSSPNATYNELKATFKRDYLGRFAQYYFLESDIEKAKKWKELGEDHYHYFLNDILINSDGIQFVVCIEWERTNIIPVLGIIKAMGWKIEILK